MMQRMMFISMVVAMFAIGGCGGSSSSSASPPDNTDDMETPIVEPDPLPGDDAAACDNSAFQLLDNGRLPADGAEEVPLNTHISLLFNRAVDPDTVNDATVMLSGPAAPALDVEVTDDVVTATPRHPLQPDSVYTLTLTMGLSDQCPEPVALRAEDAVATTFTTAAVADLVTPQFLESTPRNGDTLVSPTSPLVITFDKAISPGSVSGNVFLIQEGENTPVAFDIDTDGATVTVSPQSALPQQTWFRLTLSEGITDTSGNALAASEQIRFRTSGILVQLNEGVINQIPGLGDGINLVAGQLVDAAGIANDDDGLGGLDNLLVLTLPLVSALSMIDPTDFDPSGFADVFDGGFDQVPNLTNTLVAVCNPATPGEQCALFLELNLNPLSLAAVAEAFADGDPAEALQQVANALITTDGVLGLELALLAPGFEGLFPSPVSDGLAEGLSALQDGLAMVPLGIVSELLGGGAEPLVRLGLLNGSLLSLGGADGLSNAPAGIISGLVVALAGDFSQGFNPDNLPLGPLADLFPF